MPSFSPGSTRAHLDRRGAPRRHGPTVVGFPPSTGSSVQASWKTARPDTGSEGPTTRSVASALAPIARFRLTYRWITQVGGLNLDSNARYPGPPGAESVIETASACTRVYYVSSTASTTTASSVRGLWSRSFGASGARSRASWLAETRWSGPGRCATPGGCRATSRDPTIWVWIPRRQVAERLELLPRGGLWGAWIWKPRAAKCLDVDTGA